ncbi:MAG: substrate-binding domain-containing protein [Planctomycetota bacterium]
MKQITLILFAAVFAACLGCENSTGENGGSGASDASDAKFTIGMSQCNLGEPWRVQMNADVKKAADGQPDVNVIFKDAQNDSLRQRAHVEEFVSQGVDLLIISPKEAQPLTEPVAKAFEAGIPVIVLDRAVLGDKFTTFIGADNQLIGRLAGQWLVEKLGGKGKVVELKGLMTSVPGQDRHEGFLNGIEGSELEVIFEVDMKWLEASARKEMDSALARFDKIDAVFAHNDPGAHGAYLAAKASGREKEITFVGIDALPQEGVAYVQQGLLDATFAYPTGGAEAIEMAMKILAGEEVPRKIVLGSKKFTADTGPEGEAIE